MTSEAGKILTTLAMLGSLHEQQHMSEWEVEELTSVKTLRQFRLVRERPMAAPTVVYVQEVDLPTGRYLWCQESGHTAFSCEHVHTVRTWVEQSPAVKG